MQAIEYKLSSLFYRLPYDVQRHCIQTGTYARILIKASHSLAIQTTQEQICRAVFYGGLCHDIGKLGISVFILHKPGALNITERNILYQHPVYTGDLIEQIQDFKQDVISRNIILEMGKYHHERYDGTGYPYGLTGIQIPFFAQICAVADTISAMTETRTYQRARPFPYVVREILQHTGTQFSPEAVRCFQETQSEIGRAYEHFQIRSGCG